MNFKFLLMCVSVLSLVLIGCTESEEKGEEKTIMNLLKLFHYQLEKHSR